MGTPARYYSSTAVRTTLSFSIGTVDTSITVASESGFPASYPFVLVIEKDTANEEIVEVTGKVGAALTVTRGIDGTSARTHSGGVAVEHAIIADDLTDFRAHEAASANAHGVGASASIVGTTTTQTLTNKTLTSPTINGATVSGTVSGGTLSGQTITGATLGGNLAAGSNRITGLADPTSAQDAVTRNWAETGMTSQLNSATTQATNAAASASTASTQASNAATSATNAANSASAASTSASNAASSATSASNSASTATTQATNAASSATLANDWATKTSSAVAGGEFSAKYHAQQASTSASNASTSASTASTQASNASTSATNAANSASAAATSASNASTSATSASGSASTATTQASAASTSATNAASSASAASTSASNAATSETNAANSATTAGTHASNAATSATNASNSASTATSQATNAANSATAAANSASAAAADAVAAASSAASAASALDSFDDRYLGSKSSAPTLDNDGNALVTGALYYQSTGATENRGMYVFDGSGWLKASAASVASIVTYEYTATSGQTAFTGNDDNGVALSFTTGLLQVFLNGVLLSPGDDYTTSTNTVTLASGAAASDVLVVVAFASFNVANTYTTSQADSTFATKTELATQLSSAGFNPFLLMGA